MTKTPNNPDISVRGGIINVPLSTKPKKPPRHQPNTPPNKKIAKPRPDHQVYRGHSSTTAKDTAPPSADSQAPPPDKPIIDLDE